MGRVDRKDARPDLTGRAPTGHLIESIDALTLDCMELLSGALPAAAAADFWPSTDAA